jgi:hypothetical protein
MGDCDNIFKSDQRKEAEVDAWLQEGISRLEAREKIPLGDVQETQWALFYS